MNILIAGGSGIIGHSLTKALLAQGETVRVLTRHPEAAKLPSGAQAVGWDGRTCEGWLDQMAAAEVVIHLAGANIGARPWSQARKQLIRSSRVEAGHALVEAVRQSAARPRLLLQIGGVGYYGVWQGPPLDETAPPGADFLAQVAVDWEHATDEIEALGVERAILRTGVVLTPQGGVLAPFVLQNRLFVGGRLGSGQQGISWIHIQDLVRVFQFLLRRGQTPGAAAGAWNVCAPQPVTNAVFGQTVSQVMHRPYWLPVPAFALRLLLGEMSTLVLDGQEAYPRRLLSDGFDFTFDTLQKALQDLLVPRG